MPNEPEPHGGTWDDDYTDCVWPEPREFGIWCSWDANGESGPGWLLGGTVPPTGDWDYGVLAGRFPATRWSEAKAVFQMMIEWAHEALPPHVHDDTCGCDDEDEEVPDGEA